MTGWTRSSGLVLQARPSLGQPHTVGFCHGLLLALLRDAVKRQMLATSPMSLVKRHEPMAVFCAVSEPVFPEWPWQNCRLCWILDGGGSDIFGSDVSSHRDDVPHETCVHRLADTGGAGGLATPEAAWHGVCEHAGIGPESIDVATRSQYPSDLGAIDGWGAPHVSSVAFTSRHAEVEDVDGLTSNRLVSKARTSLPEDRPACRSARLRSGAHRRAGWRIDPRQCSPAERPRRTYAARSGRATCRRPRPVGAPTGRLSLLPRDPAALSEFATAVSTPGNALYRHFIGLKAFVARFGPTAAAISAVESVLRADGLRPGAITAQPPDHSCYRHGLRLRHGLQDRL